MATVQRIADTNSAAPMTASQSPPPSPTRETVLFQERVSKTDEPTSLTLTSPLLEFTMQAAEIRRLKGDRSWKELMNDPHEKQKVGEFFKYVEETAFAIIRNNKIKKGKEGLAYNMIRFLATHAFDEPDDLKSNLWIARSTKSELREPIAYIVKEFLQMEMKDFENTEWLSEHKKPKQTKFFDELLGSSDAGALYKNEHLITLDSLQILVYLTMCYPRDLDQTETQEAAEEKATIKVKQETGKTELKQEAAEEQRTAVVKPVKSSSSFPLYKIILLISAIAAAALACTLYFVI